MNSPTSISSSTSSSIGPITGEELTSVLQAEAFNSSTPQCKVGLSLFEIESSSLHSVGFEKDKIPEGQFSASDFPGIDDDIQFTALVDHTASDDHSASDDRTALDDHTASDDLNDPYDSELEVSGG